MNYAQIVDICCRDLRRYLQNALINTKGGVVSVKLQRLLRVELSHSDLVRYATCLNYMLGRYRWGRIYVIPRQEVAQLLESFDQLCQRMKRETMQIKKRREDKAQREKMPLITVWLPYDLLSAVEEYAAKLKTTRSEVVRRAIAQMLEKMRKVAEEQAAQVVL